MDKQAAYMLILVSASALLGLILGMMITAAIYNNSDEMELWHKFVYCNKSYECLVEHNTYETKLENLKDKYETK